MSEGTYFDASIDTYTSPTSAVFHNRAVDWLCLGRSNSCIGSIPINHFFCSSPFSVLAAGCNYIDMCTGVVRLSPCTAGVPSVDECTTLHRGVGIIKTVYFIYKYVPFPLMLPSETLSGTLPAGNDVLFGGCVYMCFRDLAILWTFRDRRSILIIFSPSPCTDTIGVSALHYGLGWKIIDERWT